MKIGIMGQGRNDDGTARRGFVMEGATAVDSSEEVAGAFGQKPVTALGPLNMEGDTSEIR